MSLVSLYDAASLWMTPSGAEDGKLFSELPTDGSGDFTFSRGSNLAATRVGPTGLIEKGRENFILQSNAFSTSPWSGINATLTSGQSGYNGDSDAWLLEAASDGPSRYVGQNVSSSGVNTFSCYAKAGTTDYVRIQITAGSTSFVYFDLTAGVSDATLNEISTKIEAVGSTGWYRCSLIANDSSISSVRIYVARENSVNVIAGDNIYIQNAQLEIGLAATDYIESGATTGKAGLLEDEPRLDYSGGATCPSLLLEPSRTNLISHSEYMAPSELSSYGTDVTYNATQSPSGKNSAALVYEESSNSQHYVLKGVTTSSSTTYTQSAFVKKKDSGIYASLRTNGVSGNSYIIFDFDTATIVDEGSDIISSGVVDYSNGWYRIHMTYTLATLSFIAGITNSTTNPISNYLGTGKGYYLWGAQLEAGSYPTSYIPNYSGGSVTRGRDLTDRGANLSYTGDYTLFMEFELTKDAVYLLNANNSTSYSIFLETSNTVLRFGRTGGDSAIVRFQNMFDWRAALGTTIKMAFYKSGTNAKLFVNGTSYTPSENTLSTGNEVLDWRYLNYSTTADRQEQAYIKQLLEFEEALTDAECIELTINGLKEDLIAGYTKRATFVEEGASDRLDTYLQSLEDFRVV